MARYLSNEWFTAVAAALGDSADEPGSDDRGPREEDGGGEDRRDGGAVGADEPHSDGDAVATDEPRSDGGEQNSGGEDGGARLVVQQQVEGGPDGTVVWHVLVDGTTPRMRVGPHPSPTVTFTQEYATAAAVAQGHLSAQEAFMTGRITLGGDAGALIAAAPAMTHLGDALAAVRAETTY